MCSGPAVPHCEEFVHAPVPVAAVTRSAARVASEHRFFILPIAPLLLASKKDCNIEKSSGLKVN